MVNSITAQPGKIKQWQGSYYPNLDVESWLFDGFQTSTCKEIVACGYVQFEEKNIIDPETNILYVNGGRFPSLIQYDVATNDIIHKIKFSGGFATPNGRFLETFEANEAGTTYYYAIGKIQDYTSGADNNVKVIIAKVKASDFTVVSGYPKIIGTSGDISINNTITEGVGIPILNASGQNTGTLVAGNEFINSGEPNEIQIGHLFKLTPQGVLDQSFGTNGQVILPDNVGIKKVTADYNSNGDLLNYYAICRKVIKPFKPSYNPSNEDIEIDILVYKITPAGVATVLKSPFNEDNVGGNYTDTGGANEYLYCNCINKLADSKFCFAQDILVEGNKIYLGIYFDAHFFNGDRCAPLSNFEQYIDGDIAIITLDKSNGNVIHAKKLNRTISVDFESQLISSNGKIITSAGTTNFITLNETCTDLNGNVANKYTFSSVNNILLTYDPISNTAGWNKIINHTPNPSNCIFSIVKGCDDNIILLGNTSNLITKPHREDYNILITYSDCQAIYTNWDYPNGLIINSNTTLDNVDKSIKGTLRITAGKSLTLNNCNFSFALSNALIDFNVLSQNNVNTPITRVIIERGAKLILNHSTLKGFNGCNKNWMWEGVEIWGHPDLSQTETTQGVLILTNGSLIQDAFFGAITDKQLYNINGGLDSYGWHGGGIIQVDQNSGFLNCRRAVHFAPYDVQSNVSEFNNARFINNAVLQDSRFRDGSGNQTGTNTFVSMWGTTDIKFNNCTWQGYWPAYNRGLGNGILSADAQYEVKNSTFNDVNHGIVARNPIAIGKIVNVKTNTFTNVSSGIQLHSGSNHLLINNNITLGGNLSPYYYRLGIGVFGSFGAKLYSNAVTGTGSNAFGILSDATGSVPSDHGGNAIINCSTGHQTQNNNSGLQMRCNEYTTTDHAWDINPGSPGVGLLSDQGSCDPFATQAGNKFYDYCPAGSSDEHIRSTVGFTYNFKNAPYETPTCYTQGIVNVQPCGVSNSNSCIDFRFCSTCDPTELTILINNETNVHKRRVLRNELAGYFMGQRDLTSAINVIMPEIEQIDYRKWITLLQIQNNALTEATTNMQTITAQGGNIDFISVAQVLFTIKANNWKPDQISNSQKTILMSIAQNRSYAGFLAQAILSNYFGMDFPIVYEYYTSNAQLFKEASTSDINVANKLVVYPNPVEENVTLQLPQGNYMVEVNIISLDGRLVSNFKVNSVSQLTIDKLDLTQGMYLLSVRDIQGKYYNYRIVKY